MAYYSGDLAPLNAAAVADYDAQTRRQAVNQNFLAALTAERNRRSLGEGQIGADRYRTEAGRDVGMGNVGMRGTEAANAMEIARMKDVLAREQLRQQGSQFYDALSAQERMLRDQMEARQEELRTGAGLFDGQLPMAPSVYNRLADQAMFDEQDQKAAEQAAVELNMALPGIKADSTPWYPFAGVNQRKALDAVNQRLSQLLPTLEQRSRVSIDPNTFQAVVKPRQPAATNPGPPPIDPSVARQIIANPNLRRRFNLGNISLDPNAILRRNTVPATPIAPQFGRSTYLNN